MKHIRLLLAAVLAFSAAACDSDATGSTDPRLRGTWSSGPSPVSVSSGAPVAGVYMYTLVFDGVGGYQWEAAAFDGSAARRGPVAYVRASGTVTADGKTLRFQPSVSVSRNQHGGGMIATPLGGPGEVKVEYSLVTGGGLYLRLGQAGDRDAGKVVRFHPRVAK
jgi:hypothetical protein